MGKLFCSHVWGKWGKPSDGIQQRSCRKCGKVSTKRYRCGFFNPHSWKRYGTKRKGGITVRCTKCGQTKPLT